ncbi:F-box/FBD/LRR-repeat protein At2g26030-like isoform X1 [Primulina tabacum]|uniref:F-box/FBD/LRR-repeat protein At2g26030-like isoform X1 n=1 Tax=Primulina tabacum TaxID=48773 RepID=UPI003F592ACD
MVDESIQIDRDAGKKPRLSGDKEGNEGEDIISNMPETIICQILSLLPTKDVLRTCVLSKDWEYKWTGIYNIDINDVQRFSLKTTRKTSVVNFVDRIFILSRNASLKRFRLLCQQKYDARRMVTWISAALMRNVEDLEIVYNFEGVVLPRCFFDCNSLTNLKLQLPCIFRPLQNWFSKLKDLYLGKVEILNEHAPSTSQLMFEFPVLETLELRDCNWLKVDFVEINAPSLTKFNVCSNVSEIENFQMKISAAKLVKFAVSGLSLGIFDLSASSVSCASVDFMSYACDLQGIRKNGLHARLLLKGCSGLNHLQLLTDIMEVIDQSKQGPPLPKFNMLKRLEISTRCKIEAFLEFLHSTPYLERLRLNMWDCDDYDYDSFEPIPSCIVSHLSEVEFNGFKGMKPHVHLADFFLKNAVELKKISGLFRKKCEERRAEKNFWARLKKVFGDGNFEVDSEIKNMADFERLFG